MKERSLNDRITELEDRMISVEALTRYGTANDLKFYIFDYNPKDEITIRKEVKKLCDRNPNIVEFDLYKMMMEIIEEEGYMEDVIRMETEYDKQLLLTEIFQPLLAVEESENRLEVLFENGKTIIAVNVKKGNSLYYIKKYGRSAAGCYIRVGTTCRSMTEEQIEKAYIQSLSIKEKTIFEKRNLRQNLSFSILKTLLISKGQHLNDNTFNETYMLLNENNEYNYYAGLLEDNADVSIKVATFKGKDKTVFLKRNEFGFQCLITAMQNAINYCDSINETYIDTSVRPRKESRMFSMDAFREAWINAVVHNDWKQGTPPAIYIYDDRLEIVSIGGLPKGQTIESFFNGKSVPVNEPMIRLL